MNAAGPANHHHRQHHDRLSRAEHIRADKRQVVRQQTAGQTGEERRQDKGQQFVVGHIDAHCRGSDFILANRGKGLTDPRIFDPPREKSQKQRQRQSQHNKSLFAGSADVIEADEQRRRHQSRQAGRSAGHLQVECDILEHFTTAISHDHQKRPAHPHGRCAQRQSHDGRHDAGSQERRPERPVQHLRQQGGGKSAQTEKRGMPQRSLADIAGNKVQAQRGNAVNQADQQHMFEIGRKQIIRSDQNGVDKADPQHEGRQEESAAPALQPLSPSHADASPYTFSSNLKPIRPVGLTISVRIIAMNAIASR